MNPYMKKQIAVCVRTLLCTVALLLALGTTEARAFEVSFWIDIDLQAGNGRGYWHHYPDPMYPPESTPTNAQIWAACSRCHYTYHANKLYVIYHRQFEIADAKTVFQLWKTNASMMSLAIVPTIVLQDYDMTGGSYGSNFTNTELQDLSQWCKTNINSSEFGVYDIYDRERSGASDTMLTVLYNQVGNILTRVGLQPGEPLNANFLRGVEDTWTAECQGLNNSLYSNPVTYQGTNNYGRHLLQSWVNARVSGESRTIAWDLISVAWDYTNPIDPYGYICPGDNALTNDPPITGRINLCQGDIAGCYPGGGGNAKFGGYSSDLHILEANSAGRGESPDFYQQITADQAYTGYFASGLNQVEAVYQLYNP
jgi:hypothetical protein